jgi:hypothetical protein
MASDADYFPLVEFPEARVPGFHVAAERLKDSCNLGRGDELGVCHRNLRPMANSEHASVALCRITNVGWGCVG